MRKERVFVCENCDKKMPPSTRKLKRFCDNKCSGWHRQKILIERWKQGKETGIRGKFFVSRYIRAYLFQKYNSCCCKCGWNTVNPHTGKIPLEVDHIDGNWTNNKEENLELICPNCHSLTSTYRALNTGHGRGSVIPGEKTFVQRSVTQSVRVGSL